MARKSKEKELTREEALALAKTQLAPYWRGTDPLLLGIRAATGATAHPIDPEFAKRCWMIGLLDPAQIAAPVFLDTLKTLHRRYNPHGVEALLLLSAPYAFNREPAFLEQLAKVQRLGFPFAIDPDGALFAAFGAQEPPKLLFVSEGKLIIEASGQGWLRSYEVELQKYLRQSDPGLALFRPFDEEVALIQDTGRIDFAARPGTAPWELEGDWKQEPDRLTTGDPKAVIRFDFEGTELVVVAHTQDSSGIPAEMEVEVNGAPLREANWGDDVERMEASGGVLIGSPRSYFVISTLAAGKGRIALSFPRASRAGIALYGARFGKK